MEAKQPPTDAKPVAVSPPPPLAQETGAEYTKRTGYAIVAWYERRPAETPNDYTKRTGWRGVTPRVGESVYWPGCKEAEPDPPTKRLAGLTAERAIELRREHIIEETDKAIVDACKDQGEWLILSVTNADLNHVLSHFSERGFPVEILGPDDNVVLATIRSIQSKGNKQEPLPRLRISWPTEAICKECGKSVDGKANLDCNDICQTCLDKNVTDQDADLKCQISTMLEDMNSEKPGEWISPCDLAVHLPCGEMEVFRILKELVDDGYRWSHSNETRLSACEALFGCRYHGPKHSHALGLAHEHNPANFPQTPDNTGIDDPAKIAGPQTIQHGDNPRQPDKKGLPTCW